jgi:methyl-accepting chemotaxis protein
MVSFVRKHLIVRILCAMIGVMLLIAAGYIGAQIVQTKTAVEQAINSYNMRIAESFAAKLPPDSFASFLDQPTETDTYWSLREQLNEFRTQIGARYVYFVRFDDSDQPRIMIDGLPRDDSEASPIDEITDMPPDAVQTVMEGGSASSPLIDNPIYGSYLSAYAPLKDADGKLIGAIGIDTAADVFQQLAKDVVWDSVPLYAGMLFITLILIALIAWFVQRSLSPLKLVRQSAEQMAQGELALANTTLRDQPVRSSDEIGSVYRAMLKMSGQLNEMVRDMVVNVDKTSGQLIASSQSFADQADRMVHMGETVNASVQHIYEGAEAQRQSAADTAQAMEEITLGIVRISESSATVSDAAAATLDVAVAGETAVKHMSSQMRDISGSAEHTYALAHRLKGYSAEIGGVVDVVRGFAEQTKLLALNASIEAARAGEHGAGFMVVAREVRKLADASSASVEEIAALLGNIETESQAISQEMDQATKNVGEGVTLSGEVEQAFLHAVEAFRLVSGQIIEISAATEQLTASSEEVAATVSTIAHIAGSVSEETGQIRLLTAQQLGAMREVHAASESLNESTHDMKRAIAQVKV